MKNGEDSSTYYGSITHKNTSIDLEFVVRPRFKVVVNVRDGFVNREVRRGEDAYLDTKGPKGVFSLAKKALVCLLLKLIFNGIKK